jgi:hypothetical protein
VINFLLVSNLFNLNLGCLDILIFIMLIKLFYRSENGLLAYGSNNLVVIVDTAKVIPVQCFTDHKSLIKKVNIFDILSPIYFNYILH